MSQRKPTHPGAILRKDVLPSLAGMSVSAFARCLGVSRHTLQSVLAERSGISPEMALRLGKLLGNGSQLWLDLQIKHDLWQAQGKLNDGLE
jgi:addiction module HigA family antidote